MNDKLLAYSNCRGCHGAVHFLFLQFSSHSHSLLSELTCSPSKRNTQKSDVNLSRGRSVSLCLRGLTTWTHLSLICNKLSNGNVYSRISIYSECQTSSIVSRAKESEFSVLHVYNIRIGAVHVEQMLEIIMLC
jgi:hypothetical protein